MQEQLLQKMEEYHLGYVEFLEYSAKNTRKCFMWILTGWLLMIVSSFLWTVGVKWAEWLWIPGAAIFLTGLESLYRMHKRARTLAKQLREGPPEEFWNDR